MNIGLFSVTVCAAALLLWTAHDWDVELRRLLAPLLLVVLSAWLLRELLYLRLHGATPGMCRWGLSLVRVDGRPVTWAQVLQRRLLPAAYVVGVTEVFLAAGWWSRLPYGLMAVAGVELCVLLATAGRRTVTDVLCRVQMRQD